MPSLTAVQARERAQLLDVTAYDLDLDLDRGAEVFSSTSRIAFSCRRPGEGSVLDVRARTLESVSLNGQALDPATCVDGRLSLPQLAADNVVEVVATMAYRHDGEGLHRASDPADGRDYVYGMSFLDAAPTVFACFDQPDLKAPCTLSVTAPADWVVVANGVCDGPEPERKGARRWRFATTPPLATYVVTICAGPYVSVESEHRGIPLRWFARASLAEPLRAQGPELLRVTGQGLDYYEELFGIPYAFGGYDQIFVPEFNPGAMENPGCVTYAESMLFRGAATTAQRRVRANTILHEMAHMWFGDLVTMRWWDDLWLNESFAEWASTTAQAEATRWKTAWTTFATAEKNWAYRQDQLSSTHPIVAPIRHLEDVEANFDGITYAKGASVLKQLVAYVGRDAFREGLRAYFRAHAWGNTTMADLLRELEAASGRDLAIWSDLWLNTAGVNTLRAELAIEDGTITAASLTQTAVAEHPTLRPHRLAIGLYDLTDGGSDGSDGSDSTGRRLVRRERFEVNIDGPSTTLPDLVGVRMPDFLLVNDDDLAYAKIRIDERSLAAVQAAPTGFTDSLPQALVLGAMWDMTRDAQLPAPDFVRFVLECLPAEKDSTLVRVLLSQVESATRFYTSPAHRPELAALVAHRLRALAESAEPGSDAQLQFVTAFAGWARSVEDLDLVEGLLEGSRELPGLAVDTEMRWTLLTSLAVGGRANEERIDAERRRDDTATGRERAALALAARPTSEAKEAAWVAAVETPGLPNQTIDAMAAGFGRVHDTSLLAPYVQRYHDALVGIWESRTFAIAESIVLGFYPLAVADEDLLAASQGWLDAHPDAPDALVRLAAENRDSIARALQAQACDAADD